MSVCVLQNEQLVDVVTSQLDLQPYCSTAAMKGSAQKPVYRLMSVINHHGKGIQLDDKAENQDGQPAGGHYTALCRTNDGKWFECNDSRVTKCNSVEGPSSLAYLLFFRRQG